MRTRRQRVIALLAALVLQMGIIAAVIFGFRSADREPETEEFVTTLQWLPTTLPPVAAPPPVRTARRNVSARIESAASLPVQSEAQVATPAPVLQPPVDWWTEADRVVARFDPPRRAFGAMLDQSLAPGPATNAPLHEPGQQEVDAAGNRIIWTSARCYLISEAQQLGLSAILANAQPVRANCLPKPAARGDLFKDSPAYRRGDRQPLP